MTIDKGSNQVHYLKPPYKAHVQLSLDRGARSGMDGCARTRRPRTGAVGPRSTTASTRSLNSVTLPRTTTRRPRTATGQMSAVNSVKSLKTMASRSEDRSVSSEWRKNTTLEQHSDLGRTHASKELGDRPIYGEKVMSCMTIDKGSNQVHYLKPPYKAHVQLSLDRGARSGMGR